MRSEQLQMIPADLRVMHGQAVMARTRIPVSVILDCLAADMNADEIITEYTTAPWTCATSALRPPI